MYKVILSKGKCLYVTSILYKYRKIIMEKVKTTINIDSELWKKFSHLVIDERGCRKKNEIIENLIKEYVEKKGIKKNRDIKKAVILAAGIGSRLRPLTNDVPKCLLKINSINILEQQIKNLTECGIQEITVVTGYKSGMVKRFCRENSWNINLIENKYYSDTSNLFSLWLAKETFEHGFICLNSDVVFDIEILRSLLKSEEDICLAVDKKECTEEDMKVNVRNGVITNIGKRIHKEQVYGEFIGISKFSEKGSEYLILVLTDMSTDSMKKGYVALGIQKLIERGHKVQGLEIQRRFWADIDFIEDLKEVRAYLMARPSY